MKMLKDLVLVLIMSALVLKGFEASGLAFRFEYALIAAIIPNLLVLIRDFRKANAIAH